MNILPLSDLDLALASVLILALAALAWQQQLGLHRQLLVAALRTAIQLSLVGLVLKALFATDNLLLLAAVAAAMLLLAGREVNARLQQRLAGGYWIGTGAMFVSAFVVAVFALQVLVQPTPWWEPQYSIPLLGMLLGNSMTGIALGLERLLKTVHDEADVVEQRLMLGQTPSQALRGPMRDAARAGMIPIINAMAAAGIISLPGMMTGQILAGSPPMTAVKYQILIMFMISASTGFGTLIALRLASRRLFDNRDRLRLDRRQIAPDGKL